MASPLYTAHAGRRPAYPGTSRRPKRRAALTYGPEARVPRWHRSPRRHAASTCGPEARVPQGQRAAAEAPDGTPLPHAGRRPAYPGDNRRQPKPQTACHFNVRAGGPRTPGAAGGSRSPRRRAASTCGPEARVPRWQRSPRWRAASTCGPEDRVPWWQRGSSVADACGSSLSRHPRTVPQSKNLSHRPGNVDDQDGFMVR